ncbi:polyhydroxyalkanoic acid system family protein [Methyloligella sp. 2.7D]|uniref:polyhydroxyalkanoic acid system family protein n=1 Tax=unclassified Methyloligella TaxID=2625955 RepID=UPI00157D0575|nr:polyhydroxyalkanoic acid system family protein [Methyloligella sp. GL2]QKP76987.1 polyhydroxyalkanoic acid system family protein [Methyloligella sp. GL2]
MAKPVTVEIPHNLGREEARQRLQNGFAQVRNSYGESFSVLRDDWSGDHLDFEANLLGQSANGTVDVADDHVRLQVALPWVLALFAEKAKDLIRQEGQLMLEKPAPTET